MEEQSMSDSVRACCRGPWQPLTHMQRLRGVPPKPPAHLYKSGSTGFAFVGLLSRVNSSVGFQVGWPVELGPTDVTTIGFLTYYREKREKESHIQQRLPQSPAPEFQSKLPYPELLQLSFPWKMSKRGSRGWPPSWPHLPYTHTSTT